MTKGFVEWADVEDILIVTYYWQVVSKTTVCVRITSILCIKY